MPTDSPKTVPKRRAKWKMRVLALALGSILAIGIGELVVLLSGVNNHYREPAVSQLVPQRGGPYELAENGYVPHSTLVTVYPTNPRGYFDTNNAVHHKFNSEGWRDTEHPIERPENTYRILGIGDSYMFGQGVRTKDLFITQLPKLLGDSIDQKQVETINAGQSAYNTSMELQLLKQRGFDYQPDMVLLCFVPNDVEPDVFSDGTKIEFFKDFTSSYNTNDWLSNYSELWMYVQRTTAYGTAGQKYLKSSIDSYQDDSEKWQKCRQSLVDMKSACDENGAEFMVVIFPFLINLDGDYPFQLIHDQVNKTCNELGISVVDLRETLRTYQGPELWVHQTDQHPNEEAHKIAAQTIANRIKSDLK